MTARDDLSADYQRFKGWQSERFGNYRQSQAAYFRHSCATASRLGGQASDQSMRLLEIGFGNGAFLGWARDQGHEVHGVEVQPQCLEAGRAAGFSVYPSLSALAQSLGTGQFDGVVMLDVLEHIPAEDLLQFLKDVRQVMRPTGWMALRFPNGDSPFGRRNQHGDLTHGCTLGSVAVHQLAGMTGYRVLSIGCQPLPIVGNNLLRALIHACLLVARFIFELPLQALLNLYYPGQLMWYPLHPNLAVWLKVEEGR